MTTSPATDLFPAFSPDGTRLAFISNRGGKFDLYTMRLDGGGLRQLTNFGARAQRPAWSPDGRQIAFSSARDGDIEVYAINADGSGLRHLTDNRAQDFEPSWR